MSLFAAKIDHVVNTKHLSRSLNLTSRIGKITIAVFSEKLICTVSHSGQSTLLINNKRILSIK